ncbi:hypothetical protein DBR37_07365 [Herminiimonas sp. KBW02]|uniref:DUF4124 domain-containing protein n=1 Tax=Herminiimonas sp. KBW02 TaxID=2153363 RepID=UPI000F59E3C2|nr:DUF4124 domain-containing protein [Herminiimonas sp. KBW02]RQO36138.1 hypothetical protein DBR37_07365 [Herminiimonas sp. KBW02]
MPFLLLFALFSLPLPALAIYKCESGGKISYSDLPCNGTGTKQRFERIITPPPSSDTHLAQENLIREKRILQAMETQRRKEEASAEKERQRIYKEQERKRKRCATLEQRARWAKEDAARASVKRMAREQRKAQRAAEKLQLECGP